MPAKKSPENQVLILGNPLNADGTLDTTLHSTMLRKYASVVLKAERGNATVATIVDPDPSKVTEIGTHTINFLCSLVNGVLGGQGNSPDGSALFVAKYAKDVLGHHSAKFPKYRLVVTPKDGARTSAKAYEAQINKWLDAAMGRAGIIDGSIDKHGLASRNTRKSTVTDEAPAAVQL